MKTPIKKRGKTVKVYIQENPEYADQLEPWEIELLNKEKNLSDFIKDKDEICPKCGCYRY